jgi:hypothetical protein
MDSAARPPRSKGSPAVDTIVDIAIAIFLADPSVGKTTKYVPI